GQRRLRQRLQGAVGTVPAARRRGRTVHMGPVGGRARGPAGRAAPAVGPGGPPDRDPGAAAVNRFSFNQATANHWPMEELVAGCVEAGVSKVGLWREQVAAYGLAATAKLVREAGLTVTSLCRGGFFST